MQLREKPRIFALFASHSSMLILFRGTTWRIDRTTFRHGSNTDFSLVPPQHLAAPILFILCTLLRSSRGCVRVKGDESKQKTFGYTWNDNKSVLKLSFWLNRFFSFFFFFLTVHLIDVSILMGHRFFVPILLFIFVSFFFFFFFRLICLFCVTWSFEMDSFNWPF